MRFVYNKIQNIARRLLYKECVQGVSVACQFAEVMKEARCAGKSISLSIFNFVLPFILCEGSLAWLQLSLLKVIFLPFEFLLKKSFEKTQKGHVDSNVLTLVVLCHLMVPH